MKESTVNTVMYDSVNILGLVHNESNLIKIFIFPSTVSQHKEILIKLIYE